MLSENFRFLRDQLGGDHVLVKEVLAGKTPEQAASEYNDDIGCSDRRKQLQKRGGHD